MELESEISSRFNEMDTDIFTEFKRKYKCDDCDFKTFDMLLHEFEVYKRKWVSEMVDFIIRELEIDEERAKFVRSNPEKYFVDYQTFKLLSFSWSSSREELIYMLLYAFCTHHFNIKITSMEKRAIFSNLPKLTKFHSNMIFWDKSICEPN